MIKVETNFGKTSSGWWWGCWQDGVLVGFGAGYRFKKTCFRVESRCKEAAMSKVMPEVECECPYINRRGQ